MENPWGDYEIGKCDVLEQNNFWGLEEVLFMDDVFYVEKVEWSFAASQIFLLETYLTWKLTGWARILME